MEKIKKLLLTATAFLILTPTIALALQPIIVVVSTLDIIHDIYVGTQERINCDWKGICTRTYYPIQGRNDIYYNENDLIAHFKEFEDSYGFDASLPPVNAVASLPERKFDDGARMASASSATRTPYYFDRTLKDHWDKFDKGDIIFNAGTNKANRILEPISAWTHVGMKYDGYLQVFDSIPGLQNGVGVRSAYDSFGSGYAYAVKKVQGLSQNTINAAVETAKRKYEGTRYCPPYFMATIAREHFIRAWADKNNTSNINCAKLAWLTFKDVGIDLDSERTTSKIWDNSHKIFSAELAKWVEYAWIGVSPDDIYYSKHMGRDKYLIGQLAGSPNKLTQVTP